MIFIKSFSNVENFKGIPIYISKPTNIILPRDCNKLNSYVKKFYRNEGNVDKIEVNRQKGLWKYLFPASTQLSPIGRRKLK
jgi:hypothetical protein